MKKKFGLKKINCKKNTNKTKKEKKNAKIWKKKKYKIAKKSQKKSQKPKFFLPFLIEIKITYFATFQSLTFESINYSPNWTPLFSCSHRKIDPK